MAVQVICYVIAYLHEPRSRTDLNDCRNVFVSYHRLELGRYIGKYRIVSPIFDKSYREMKYRFFRYIVSAALENIGRIRYNSSKSNNHFENSRTFEISHLFAFLNFRGFIQFNVLCKMADQERQTSSNEELLHLPECI
jgi:hypothetical protein